MEVKKIKNILTAIGNPILNNQLKKIKDFNILNNDIQYQDGIFEILETNKKIDFLILSQLIPGNLKIEELTEELIEEIKNNNSEIKIILILEKYDEKLEKKLKEKGVYRIFYDNKIEIEEIIKIINEDDKIEKYNEEIRREIEELKTYIINDKKNEEKKTVSKNKKIISILGNNGSGKSVFSVMLANKLKKVYKKVLIIDFDILNNSLHTILGVKKYSNKIEEIIKKNNINEINVENLIININKKIDLISGINLLFDSFNKISTEKLNKIINKLSIYYDAIIIDTTSECFFDYTKEIMKISDDCIFLTEANLLELSKSKRLLEIYKNNWNIENDKIKIIFNKFNKNSIDMNLLKKLYSDYNILGNIKLNNNLNFFINKNLKNINIEKIFYKNYKIFAQKIG